MGYQIHRCLLRWREGGTGFILSVTMGAAGLGGQRGVQPLLLLPGPWGSAAVVRGPRQQAPPLLVPVPPPLCSTFSLQARGILQCPTVLGRRIFVVNVLLVVD